MVLLGIPVYFLTRKFEVISQFENLKVRGMREKLPLSAGLTPPLGEEDGTLFSKH